jgi:hypothetical protein
MATDARPSFWATLPGVLAGTAAVLTAVTGLYVAFRNPGKKDSPPPAAVTADRPREPTDSAFAGSFVRLGSFPVQPASELVLRTAGFALRDTSTFLVVTDAAYGAGDPSRPRSPNTFRFELTITNTGTAPIQLDLTSRFFSLEDDQGRTGALRYFCCPATGDLLSPGQSRRVVLMFFSDQWYGKELRAHRILLRVQGLLPVERATWAFPTLATAA